MFCCIESFLQSITSVWFLIIITIILFYVYLTWNFKHWELMNVPYIPPIPFFGNVKERLMFKVSFAEMQEILYNKLKGNKCGGFFEGRRANLMLLDPELIRQIMVRDFECFVDRQTTPIRPKSYEESNLLLLKGTQWKEVRSISTPIFSSGKMKLMSGLIIKCTQQMTKYLDTYYNNDKNKELEMKDFFGRFTLDVIASSAFGVQCNSLENPDAEFVKITSKFNEIKFMKRLAIFFSIVVLGSFRVAKLLGVRFMNKETVDFLAHVLLEGKAQRENDKHVHRRVDFLQLMLDAKAGKLKIGSETKDEDDIFEKEARLKDAPGTKASASSALTDEVVIGQSLLFLIAGYETSSTLLTFAAYELALHPELQDRARAEVQAALAQHDGEFVYEALAKMPFLENILNETLRKHPPVSRVDRVCTTNKYHLAGTNVHLCKGDVVSIPIRGLHYDEKYYPEPNKFDPDRFLPENKQKRSPYVYLPFGSGPRNCIGMRFAMMSSKMAMASLLNVYKFETSDRTEIPFKISKGSIFLKAANGIYLNVLRV